VDCEDGHIDFEEGLEELVEIEVFVLLVMEDEELELGHVFEGLVSDFIFGYKLHDVAIGALHDHDISTILEVGLRVLGIRLDHACARHQGHDMLSQQSKGLLVALEHKDRASLHIIFDKDAGRLSFYLFMSVTHMRNELRMLEQVRLSKVVTLQFNEEALDKNF
jgi:hypothetical protein